MRRFLRMVAVAGVVFGSGCAGMKAERSSTVVHTTCPGLSRPTSTPVIIHSTKCDFPSPSVEKVIIPPPEALGIFLK